MMCTTQKRYVCELPWGGGGVNFNYLPQRGEDYEKFKKGWKYGAGAGLLKRGVGTFPIYFCQGLSCLHLEITLSFAKLC